MGIWPLPAWSCILCLQTFIKWSTYNLPMLNIVLHTLLIYLTMHSEGTTESGQVFVFMFCFGQYVYHFGHIVELFGLLVMGHKCLRSMLFNIDECLAICDIPAETLTLGWGLHLTWNLCDSRFCKNYQNQMGLNHICK